MLRKLYISCFFLNLLIDQAVSGLYLYPDKFNFRELHYFYLDQFQNLLVYSIAILALFIGLAESSNYESRKQPFIKGLIYGAIFFIPLYTLTALHPGWEKHDFPSAINLTQLARIFSSFVFFGVIIPSFLPDSKNRFDSHWKKLVGCAVIYLAFYPLIHAFFRYLFVAMLNSPDSIYGAPPIWNFNVPSLLISVGIIVTYFFGPLAAAGYTLIHAAISLAQYFSGYYVPEHNLNVALVSIGVIFYFFKYDAAQFQLNFFNKIKTNAP